MGVASADPDKLAQRAQRYGSQQKARLRARCWPAIVHATARNRADCLIC
jgi:hypothetical protein